MKNQKPDDDTKLTLRWACDERTIRRWRKARAPLGDVDRMRAWLAGRKHLPLGTVALLEATRATERATPGEDSKQVEGAAAALRRLEQAEASGYVTFKRATASGDDVAIKTARENWLRISESLRRFDIALEQNRRETGQLIPRAELEQALSRFGWCMRVAGETVAGGLAMKLAGETDFVRIRSVIRKCGYDVAVMGHSTLAAMGIADWIVNALAMDIVRETTTTHDQIQAIATFIRDAIGQRVEERIAAESRGQIGEHSAA